MAKSFQTLQQQISYLENDKNLVVSDHVYAEAMLKQIGYFSLIGGYKTPFKNPTTHKYKDGTRFEDIVALYDFDENLRELVLKYILKIERHIRSLIAYHFTEKYGELQAMYLNSSNYSSNPKHTRGITQLISILNKLVYQNTDYPYINHYRQIHGNIPLWVLTNSITLGNLSKFYEFSTQDIRSKVARNFEKVNQKQLEQYLSVMTKFRNVCAHGERLYSYNTRNDIPDTVLHQKLLIPKNGTQYSMGKHDLFSMIITFRYLLSNDDFKKFNTSLKRIVKMYLNSPGAMSESSLYIYMGFPSNWRKITRYRK